MVRLGQPRERPRKPFQPHPPSGVLHHAEALARGSAKQMTSPFWFNPFKRLNGRGKFLGLLLLTALPLAAQDAPRSKRWNPESQKKLGLPKTFVLHDPGTET